MFDEGVVNPRAPSNRSFVFGALHGASRKRPGQASLADYLDLPLPLVFDYQGSPDGTPPYFGFGSPLSQSQVFMKFSTSFLPKIKPSC